MSQSVFYSNIISPGVAEVFFVLEYQGRTPRLQYKIRSCIDLTINIISDIIFFRTLRSIVHHNRLKVGISQFPDRIEALDSVLGMVVLENDYKNTRRHMFIFFILFMLHVGSPD